MREWIIVTAPRTSPSAFYGISIRFVQHFNDEMTAEALCRHAKDEAL
jgi:hypothetical protein